ncbi:TonB-dependent receptor [Uliginosibacterium sp. H1]|uniref:TonB-dependent receptor n=1 Tax=Uliginosibacterium sp. H1 TaxID=3114757 RepID=UPI002E19BF2F|nr:TonB-dependent receptor [Uliginosibacterium sp. H1]
MSRRSPSPRYSAGCASPSAVAATRLPAIALRPVVLAVHLATAGALFASAGWAPDAHAQAAEQARRFNIPAGTLTSALNRFAEEAGVFLSAPAELTQGKASAGLSGSYTVEQGFGELLRGQGLEAVRQAGGSYALRVAPGQSAAQAPDATFALATLPVVTISAAGTVDELPAAYAGGQVGKGGRVGLLGNRDLMETPFSTTSYTSKMIEDQQASSLGEVLRADASVRDIFPESGSAEHFNVRGFYMQSHDSAWNGLFGLVPHNRIATEFLERVEVLRGPGALLYGMTVSGAVGGVINLVPKRAAAEPLTRLTANYASDANLGAHVDAGRRFGVDKEFGVRVNLAAANGDTALDGQSQERLLGAVAFDYLGERARASLDAYSVNEQLDGGMPLLTTFAGSRIPDAPDASTNTMPGAYSDSASKAVIGSFEFDFTSEWTGFVAGGVKNQESGGYINDALGMNAQVSGAYTGLAMNVKNYFDVTSAEAGIRGRVRTGAVGHQLVLSGNIVEQEYGLVANRAMWQSNLYAPTRPVLAAEPAVAPKSTGSTLSSVALADTLSFAQDKYLLTLGARKQRVRSKNFAVSGAVLSSYDEQALTPAVAFVARPWTPQVSLYANYIEGLSQGGSVTDASASNYGEVFAPYKSKQVELGVKWDASGFLNTLSLFRITRPSLIRNAGTNTWGPDGEQRNIGIEWTTAGEVTRGWRLLGGLTHIDAENTRTTGGTLDGKAPVGVPSLQVNLGTEWDLPWLPGLTLNATAIHTGSQFADNNNLQELPAWTRVDLGARYATKLAARNVVVRGGITNAFNERYWSGVWNGYASVGAPRSVQLSASVDF